jgi:hypothetical protein
MQDSIEGPLTPDRPVVRRTASSLLAKFLPNKTIEHKMALTGPTLRENPRVSYATLDCSISLGSQSQDSNAGENESDEDEEEEDDEIQYEDHKHPTRKISRHHRGWLASNFNVSFSTQRWTCIDRPSADSGKRNTSTASG